MNAVAIAVKIADKFNNACDFYLNKGFNF
jgi:hypothetical protein